MEKQAMAFKDMDFDPFFEAVGDFLIGSGEEDLEMRRWVRLFRYKGSSQMAALGACAVLTLTLQIIFGRCRSKNLMGRLLYSAQYDE